MLPNKCAVLKEMSLPFLIHTSHLEYFLMNISLYMQIT